MSTTTFRLVSRRKLALLLGMPWEDLDRIADVAGRYYKPFDRRRVRGTGSWRHIDNPQDILKLLQSRILRTILAPFPLPPTMCGGVPGRSTKDHAQLHVGQPVVVTLDLKSCFPRTTHDRVYRVYTKLLGCSPDIARLLTKLTTFQGRVPQGAPTSPTLVNLTLRALHDALAALATDLSLAMSFYVDDIAFSGERARDVIDPAIAIVRRHGYSVSRKKTHAQPLSARQDVTGQVVNARLGISRTRRSGLYHRIHELAAQEHPLHRDLQSIRGAISQIRWVNPAQGAALGRLSERLLPAVGVDGPRPRTDETRACRHRRRHRGRPPLSPAIQARASLFKARDQVTPTHIEIGDPE
jgi:RNA-directed DNA polymerase